MLATKLWSFLPFALERSHLEKRQNRVSDFAQNEPIFSRRYAKSMQLPSHPGKPSSTIRYTPEQQYTLLLYRFIVVYSIMPTLDQRLRSHLEDVSGQRLTLTTERTSSLPLFLSERYHVLRTELFGRTFLLAVEKGLAASTGECEQHSNLLHHHLGEAAVLVLPPLTQTARNRSVQRGVPFIVPGSQIFLPTAVIDLRARFPQPKPRSGKALTPAAQSLLLYHLQRHSLEGMPLKQIAASIGYPPIMLSHVKDELENAGFCVAERQGRAITLSFQKQGHELWD
jgi:hypothetical protein